MLPTFLISADADTDYDRCIRYLPCKQDGQDITKLPKPERDKIMECRINRHLKCSMPEKD